MLSSISHLFCNHDEVVESTDMLLFVPWLASVRKKKPPSLSWYKVSSYQRKSLPWKSDVWIQINVSISISFSLPFIIFFVLHYYITRLRYFGRCFICSICYNREFKVSLDFLYFWKYWKTSFWYKWTLYHFESQNRCRKWSHLKSVNI